MTTKVYGTSDVDADPSPMNVLCWADAREEEGMALIVGLRWVGGVGKVPHKTPRGRKWKWVWAKLSGGSLRPENRLPFEHATKAAMEIIRQNEEEQRRAFSQLVDLPYPERLRRYLEGNAPPMAVGFWQRLPRGRTANVRDWYKVHPSASAAYLSAAEEFEKPEYQNLRATSHPQD